jgi:hypothetical protein
MKGDAMNMDEKMKEAAAYWAKQIDATFIERTLRLFLDVPPPEAKAPTVLSLCEELSVSKRLHEEAWRGVKAATTDRKDDE